MTWLEKRWYEKKGSAKYLVWLLLPLTLLFLSISSLRRLAFKHGWVQSTKFNVPVMVIGNISVGGTGKTPFVIYLTKLLTDKGLKVAIVSRGYGAKQDDAHPFPRHVNNLVDVSLTGDEPKLLAMRTNCPVYIGPDRTAVISKVIDEQSPDIIISDDGLQHYKMARDIEVALVDGARGHGNGYLLPMGPLRESVSRLEGVDCTVVNSGFAESAVGRLYPDYRQVASCLLGFDGSKKNLNEETRQVHLVSGIGNPSRFEKTALKTGLKIASTTWFPDHHNFVESDFEGLKQLDPNTDIVLMTEKDAVKCTQFYRENWFILPIEAVLSEPLEQQLLTLINKHLNKN